MYICRILEHWPSHTEITDIYVYNNLVLLTLLCFVIFQLCVITNSPQYKLKKFKIWLMFICYLRLSSQRCL